MRDILISSVLEMGSVCQLCLTLHNKQHDSSVRKIHNAALNCMFMVFIKTLKYNKTCNENKKQNLGQEVK